MIKLRIRSGIWLLLLIYGCNNKETVYSFDEFPQTIDLSDYKEVDGYMFPYKLSQTMGPQSIDLEVTSVKINTGLPDEMFEIK